MSENKTGKPALPAGRYFKYAIGEIILVFIGIVMALQFNNWNQSRLERNEEQIILNNLKDDFTSAIEEFKALNAIRNDIISTAKEIIGIDAKVIDSYPTKYLDSLLGKTITAPTFNNEAGSLNVLLTSGKVNLITNQGLKKKLIAWPGDVADMTEDEVNHNEQYHDKYLDFIENYLSWSDIGKTISRSVVRFNSYSFESLPDNPNVISDYRALLSHKPFLNVLSYRSFACMSTNAETLVLIQKAEAIIEIIDSELE